MSRRSSCDSSRSTVLGSRSASSIHFWNWASRDAGSLPYFSSRSAAPPIDARLLAINSSTTRTARRCWVCRLSH
jgi:hypothetical protein